MNNQIAKYLFLICLLVSCTNDPYTYHWEPLTVTASAYNSVKSQTDDDPHITAFGDSLVPGLKYIAVSRDLQKMGLKHNTKVKIEGFKDVYIVKDKMHGRWKNRIDIYMGNDVKAAKNWGVRKVKIHYQKKVLKDST